MSWSCDALNSVGNQYFDMNAECRQDEQGLFDQTLTEGINQKGIQVKYYPVSFNIKHAEEQFQTKEDPSQYVIRWFYLMVYSTEYIRSTTDNSSLSGLIYASSPELIISISHFRQASTYRFTEPDIHPQMPQPRIGDIIAVQNNKKWFYYEITYCTDTHNMLETRKRQFDVRLRLLVNRHYTLSEDITLVNDDIENVFPRNFPESQNPLHDIFNDNKEIEKRIPDIEYSPRPGEISPKASPTNPFSGW